MPKMKSHRGAAKRFRLTGSGKVVRAKAYKSHLLEKKSAKRKASLTRKAEISAADRGKVKKLISK